jgi:hypothetical protein
MEHEHELEEAAEKAREPFERTVGATMAIVAAVLALVSVYGHLSTTEELLLQQKASDQWAYYQSKSIRRYQSEFAGDLLGALNAPAATQAAGKYAANTERYRQDSEQIQERARELERESEAKGRMALRLHLGEIFLEIAIVFSSLALLTRRRSFWLAAVVVAVTGVAVSGTVFLIAR